MWFDVLIRKGRSLFAAKHHAGNVVELPRRAYEFVYAPHQVLQRVLCYAGRQRPDRIKPALIAKFLASLIECFDHSVGKEDQRVAWLESGRAHLVRRRWFDAERQSSRFERLRRSVPVPKNRGIVS